MAGLQDKLRTIAKSFTDLADELNEDKVSEDTAQNMAENLIGNAHITLTQEPTEPRRRTEAQRKATEEAHKAAGNPEADTKK